MRPQVRITFGLAVIAVLQGCASVPDPTPAAPDLRTETLELTHGFGGQVYTVAFLPDAAGHTYVTAEAEILSASGPPTARLALSGGGLTRKDYFPALRVVADVCRTRTEFACRAFARDNGGPIFVGGRWLFQFSKAGGVS